MFRLIPVCAAAMAALALCACSERPRPAGSADPGRGRDLIGTLGCGSCHEIPGVPGADGLVGPSLRRVARRTVIAGVLPNTPDNMVHWIEAPQSVAPGNAMPNLEIDDHDARDVAAYLYTLR